MPRTRSLAWSELKIGVLTIIAIVVAAVLIFELTGSRGMFFQRYPLKTRVANVAGLASGSPVRVAGVEVGTVTAVEFAGDQVDVVFEVKKSLRSRITDKSVASLGSVSLLGESAVDITPATSGTPIPDYGYVPAGRAEGTIAAVSEQVTGGIDQITGLVKDVRAGKGTVGKLMTDEQLYVELRQFTASANGVTEAIQKGRGTIGRLITDRKAADSLEASLRNLQTMTDRLNAGEGSLGKLLKDETFAQSLSSTTTNLRTLTERLNQGQGTAGRFMTDETLFNRMNDLASRLNDVVTRLNSGEGTAGQLLKDKQLYENMNTAVNEFRTLLTEIRKDPRKYLNVKVSIF